MSYPASPHQDLFGLARVRGQAPNPARVVFEDFLGESLGSVASTTASLAKYHIGGVGTEAITLAATIQAFSSGHISMLTGSSSGDTACMTGQSPVVRWLEGQADGSEAPIAFYARVAFAAAASINTGTYLVGLGADDGAALDPTTDVFGASAAAGCITSFVGFVVAPTTGLINAVVRIDTGADTFTETSTSTGVTVQGLGSVTNSNYMTLGWEYDGKAKVVFYVNGEAKVTYTLAEPNLPVTNSILFQMAAAKATTAAAVAMRVDYLYTLYGGPRGAQT